MFIINKKYKTERNSSVFSLRMQNAKIKKLDRIADETGVNRNQIINQMVDYALDEIEKNETIRKE